MQSITLEEHKANIEEHKREIEREIHRSHVDYDYFAVETKRKKREHNKELRNVRVNLDKGQTKVHILVYLAY